MAKRTTGAPEPGQQDVQDLINLYSSGRLADAETRARALIGKFPKSLVLRDILGATLGGQGKHEEAAESCRKALRIDPDYVEAHSNLGIALKNLGRLEEAVASYRKALMISPAYVQAHNNLGIALKELGKLDEAVASYRRALEIKPDFAQAHYNLGLALQETGTLDEAVESYKRALKFKPDYVEAHSNLGKVLFAVGRVEEAIASCVAALKLNPDHITALSNLAVALQSSGRVDGSVELRNPIIRCFENREIESSAVGFTSQKILRSDLKSYPESGNVPAGKLQDLDPSTGGLLTAHLRNALITDPDLEGFLTGVRKALLECRGNPSAVEIGSEPVFRLPEALACQGFLNEFIWHVTDDENLKVERLENEIVEALEDGNVPASFDLLLLAAYRQLYRIEPIRDWALNCEPNADSTLKQILEKTVLEPARETEIADAIAQLTSVDDDTSVAVQSQYEENPYPRWDSIFSGKPRPYTQHICDEIHPHRPALAPTSDAPKVLIAGCGTGKQPISAALRFVRADILGVDLSRASLAYGTRKAEEYEVSNIRFAQGDVLKLGVLKERFDVIGCSGVLHHLADPEAGLKALLSILKPGGFIKIALYSDLARQDIAQWRQYVSERCLQPDLPGLREFRTHVREADCPDSATVQTYEDFYSASMVRDLVFHVQEHRFSLPQIETLLENNALEFLGFYLPDPRVKSAYLKRFPADPNGVELQNWHQFEKDNPTMFVAMYQFWCRKNA